MGGGVRAIAMYAQELIKLGHEVTIVSTGPKLIQMHKRIWGLLKGRGWWKPVLSKSHFDSIEGVKRIQFEKPTRPPTGALPDGDVIIATWWQTAEWVATLPPSKGTPIYFVQHHEVVFNNQPVERVRATYRLPMRKICCAQWLADLMASEYGDPSAVVVPYGIDHTVFHAPPRQKNDRPTLGLMYALATFKGTDIALRAIEIARKRMPELRVLAFGEVIRPLELPVPDYVEFEVQPSQERIAQMYAACDAWLFSSRCEGFGLPILEAMACRTPVIGTPTGIAQEVIAEGGGVMTKMEDPDAMADAIIEFCGMYDAQWRRLSDAAVATASRFRWDVSARAFEACLKSAVTD
jgi:glycosyltransferase involved in cell wall biosynthesis